VGDEVNFICLSPPKYRDYATGKAVVRKVESNKVLLQSWVYTREIPLLLAEHHEGKLYFFEDSGYPPASRNKRKMMLKILDHTWKRNTK
jgi:hypothetical protein